MTSEVTKTLHINGSNLLDEHPSRGAIDIDHGPERCRPSARGCRRHHHYGAWEEGIGLHDDAEATSSLLVPQSFRESQGEDVTPTHGGSP